MISRRVRAVVGVGLILIAVAVFVVLSQRAPRLAGTNSVRAAEYIAAASTGKTLCQHGEYVPKGTAAVRLFTGAYGGSGVLRFAVHEGGQRARSAMASFGDGWIAVPISEITRPLNRATICVRNLGRARLALAGLQSRPEKALRLDGRAGRGQVAIEYLRPSRESWWEIASTIARRVGDVSSTFLGRSVLWIAAVLMLSSTIIAVRLVLRAGET